MVTYKSAKSRTVSVGRLQINAETGITILHEDDTLEQLVKEGFLVKELEKDLQTITPEQEVALVEKIVEKAVETVLAKPSKSK